MGKTSKRRLEAEARFQDERMLRALSGEHELRDRFYFINADAFRKFLSLHEGLSGRRVVVVGSSDGGVTPLARQKVHVEGIDISPVSIAALQRAIEMEGLSDFASARVMNAEALDYPPASVDAISCSGVLHHLDTERALRSWARCLKDDGYVALFEPMAFHPIAALFRLLTPGMRTSDEHPLRPRDFHIMQRHFNSVDTYFYGISTVASAAVSVLPGGTNLARSMLPRLEAFDRWLLRVFPCLWHVCWLTVIRLGNPRQAATQPSVT